MITDLHLLKYLEDRLSPSEKLNVEKLMESHPEMRLRLEELQSRPRPRGLGRPIWKRLFTAKPEGDASKVRFNSIMPILLLLTLVLIVGSHWFAKPGRNSTFVLGAGNGTAVELLYETPRGWKYLDANYRPTDSLSFSIRDSGHYHLSVKAISAINAKNGQMEVISLWEGGNGLPYGKATPKPVFIWPTRYLSRGDEAERHLVVVYDSIPLPILADSTLARLISPLYTEGQAPGFYYQVFSSAR